MTRRTFGGISVFLAVVFLWMPAQPAHAIWTNLTPEQATRAMKVGGFQASMGNPQKFMERWTVSVEGGSALLMTEFLSVAFAAQVAAANMASLQPWEVQDALGRARGKLVFSVTTTGTAPDFADGQRGWVVVDGKRMQNSHWKNGTPTKTEDGRYIADATFWFLSKGIDPDSTVELLIENDDTGKTWKFLFDLSKMR